MILFIWKYDKRFYYLSSATISNDGLYKFEYDLSGPLCLNMHIEKILEILIQNNIKGGFILNKKLLFKKKNQAQKALDFFGSLRVLNKLGNYLWNKF